MLEVVTEAIVLDKEALGESDSRVFLYAKDLGKVIARATSARKITSKLSPHLEPFNHITVRLASRLEGVGGQFYQLTDALKIGGESAPSRQSLSTLSLLKSVLPAGIPDKEIWDFLIQVVWGRPIDFENTLKFLGFDPVFAKCETCQTAQPEYFYAGNSSFACRLCIPAFGAKDDFFIKIK